MHFRRLVRTELGPDASFSLMETPIRALARMVVSNSIDHLVEIVPDGVVVDALLACLGINSIFLRRVFHHDTTFEVESKDWDGFRIALTLDGVADGSCC